MSDYFKRPLEEYTTSLYPVKNYIQQAAVYVSKMQDISISDAINVVKQKLKTSDIKNPIVTYRYRNEKGDTSIEETKLTNYIKDALEQNEILVPSFTRYMHPSKRKSLHVDFLTININARNIDKYKEFKYKQHGDLDKSRYYGEMQKTRKTFNNALSGAYASKSTILFNLSAHYTLTSITRSIASIGNSVSESMIAGNKHFKDPDITLNYVVAIVATVNMKTIEYAVYKYKLYTPTPDEVMDMILYSSKYYWRDDVAEANIKLFLTKLTPIELAAVMYVNDLWHMRKYNESVIKDMLTRMATKVEHGSVDNLKDIKKAPEGVANLAHHICATEIKGMSINYDELVDTPLLDMLASTCKNIVTELERYKALFRAFFTTDILPIGIAHIKNMLRDAIVLSDTDSTCGSYDKWVEWYFGKNVFSQEAVAISAVVMTINTQVIDHNIKIFAKNMNIDTERVELLKMKNEYYWSTFAPANVSKHYYANTLIREGNVYKEPELERKGVHLIASANDQEVAAIAKKLMIEINTKVSNNEKLELYSYVKMVADIERDLIKRITSGDLSVYRKEKIKEAEAYKNSSEESPYINHILWESVFSDTYGTPGPPPYNVIRIPLELKSKKKFNDFLDSMENKEIATKLRNYTKKYNKDTLGSFRPPIAVISSKGIPVEMVPAINVKGIVEETCNVLYLILETLSFYRKPSMLISEMGY
jgi:hypothetical protein